MNLTSDELLMYCINNSGSNSSGSSSSSGSIFSKNYQVKFGRGPPELIGHLSIPKTLSTRHVLLDMMHCEI